MNESLRILIIDDSEDDALLMLHQIKKSSYNIEYTRIETAEEMKTVLGEKKWDVILCDYLMPRLNGLEAFEVLKESGFDIPFIVISGTIGEDVAVAAMKAGAHDYIMKNNLHRLLPAIERELRELKSREERKLLEQKQKQAEANLRLQSMALEAAANCITITDKNGTILWVNRAFTDLTGYIADEAIGKKHSILKSGIQDAVFYENLWQTIMSGKVWHNELMNRRKDGILYAEEMTITPVHTQDGVITHFIAVKQNITERKHAEEEKAKLEMMLRQSQKMEAIGTMAGGIAHDFNNILSVLIGYGSLLQKKLGNDNPLKAYADNIISSSEKAASLTRSLLTFSKCQLKDIKPVKINAVVIGMESLLHRILSENLEFRLHLADEDPAIMADVNQIDQMLLNLAANARDAMSDGGCLTIETSVVELDSNFIRTHGFGVPGKCVLLSVSDTGSGIDENIRQKIFEPFFTTKTVGKGTGLGLAIVYGIVKGHDGYININSEPGEGATFNIYLPLVDEYVPVSTSENLEISGGSETVLIVEDNEDSLKLLKEVMESAGYNIIEAVNGLDAVNKYNNFKSGIDLILMDVVMPVKNGVEAYNEIKKINPDIKIMFMSGYTGDILFKKGMIDKFNFISKPVSPNALLIKVRSILDNIIE